METDGQYTITEPDQSEGQALTLVSFASDKVCEEFAQVLRELGYPHSQVSGNDWLSLPTARYYDIRVLLISRDKNDLEKVSSVLIDSISVPTLAVFDCKLPTWDSRIIQHSSDFIGWPCHKNELALRLKGIRSRLESKPADQDEPEIIEEFIGLNMVGRSPAFLNTLNLIKKIARCDASVCIEGETGTGKELAARAIHYLGARRDFPFIPVNCGAIPDNLLENELFGHEKGAFTDAKSSQKGLFAQAQGGTLFLDEVDALSPKAQISLLRFLQDQEFRPLGSEKSVKIDVRIVVATNSELKQLILKEKFREDLYYRLMILAVELPPLRKRRGDAALLAEYFLEVYRQRYGQEDKYLDSASLVRLNSYDWPGNVRQLENTVHRQFLLAEGAEVTLRTVKQPVCERRLRDYDRRNGKLFSQPFGIAKEQAITYFEKSYLHSLLKRTAGNISEAARSAGKERRALGRLLQKYGIDKCSYFNND